MPDKSIQDLLSRLIAFDTTSSKPNIACIEFIRDYLDSFGIRSKIIHANTPGKACLWATIGEMDMPGIVLAGHTDVVPVTGQDWLTDPFALAERDGKFFGRGVADMKGFVAATLALAPELHKAKLKRPVHFAFTHDEESDMSGAVNLSDYLQKQGIKPSWVWVGEPTGFHVINSHKGVAAYKTSLRGIPGHSGQPDKGLNAIELAHDFIGIVRAVASARRAHAIPQSRFDPPYTTTNLGIINGGTAENIIAEHCDVLWQVRAHPGDTAENLKNEVMQKADGALSARFQAFSPYAGIKTCACFDIPPLMPTANNPGEQLLGKLTGHTNPEAVSFATEAGFFQALGAHAVVCGPGTIDVAHKANEFVEKRALRECVDLMRQVLL